ncbi:hypothetical protein [Streptomyces antimycoticus]|uniref:hypothetical protein n=1 Tax=Streptomyces TaxID=1883 RepID=UPI0033F2A903
MDERRPDTPAVNPAARADLSPTQQAYSAYVTHAVACDSCRSIELSAEPCTEAGALWEAYKQLRNEQRAREAMNGR